MTLPSWMREIGDYTKHTAYFLAFAIWEYWLGKTKKFAAASTGELIAFATRSMWKWFFKKGDTNTMGLQKEIQAGPAKIVFKEEKGVVSMSLSMDQSVGGGKASGVLKAKATVELDLEAKQVADLGLGLLKAQFPALGAIIDGAQAAIDAELSK